MNNRLLLSFLVVMLLSSLLLDSCKDKKQKTNQALQAVVSVEGILIEPRSIDDKIFVTGTILANEEVEIRSETSGRVININFQEGTFVRKGQILVKIDDTELQATLKKLVLDEELAQQEYDRQSRLLELNAISQEEYDQSRNRLGSIKADLDLVRAQIAKTEIIAPFNGKIGLRYISPGAFVSSSMLIARLQDISQVKIDFSIPEKYISKVQIGKEIKFIVAGSDSVFTASIYAVEPKIDLSTRSLNVRARCSNTGQILLPGSFAKAEVLLEHIEHTIVIPSQTLIPDIKGEKVFLYKDGKVKTSFIETGIRTEREVQVTEGISMGDTLITTGLLQVRENMKVSVKL